MANLLTESEAAAELGLPEGYLQGWRQDFTVHSTPGPAWGENFPQAPGQVRYQAYTIKKFRFSSGHAEALLRRVQELEAV